MIIVTGGAGFIGSAMVWRLNQAGITDILIVDNVGKSEKWQNLVPLSYTHYIHKVQFMQQLMNNQVPVDCVEGVFHIGACSSTTQEDMDYLMGNNVSYSQILIKWALDHRKRIIYASSAATYGAGEQGFDDTADLAALRPLNRYGYSKQRVDQWLLQEALWDRVAGLKFFNVFGPNEYHKADMRSMVCKAYEQIRDTGTVRLFKSHRPDFGDGEQRRDFVYIKDVVDTMWWLFQHPEVNGLYNLGSGAARTWNELARSVFSAMGIPESISYFDMPESLQAHYQYYTQANMDRLKATGCPIPSTRLEDAIADYVQGYLVSGARHLS